MSGHPDQASAAISELEGLRPGSMNIFEFDLVDRARAWTSVAAGEMSRAIDTLRQSAGRASATGQWVAEARLLHDVARLGDPGSVAPRLEQLADTIRGAFAAAFSQHATGLARNSPEGVDAAGLAFEALGAHLLAAEADIAAARLFRVEGLLGRAARATRRADTLRAARAEARTPGLLGGEAPAVLTRREREIAGLAAAGSSSREIADKLVLSVRTVENHLQNAYSKLGVSTRAGLVEALSGDDT
jgi:DNA-binding CsgD family transcriptional regulator